VNADQILGLNTLDISLVRIDYAPHGDLNPPHTHPRATEILVVHEGTLYFGFVVSNPENKLFTKVLNKGDVFVFPVGLIHFKFNIGKTKAVAIAALSSQNPAQKNLLKGSPKAKATKQKLQNARNSTTPKAKTSQTKTKSTQAEKQKQKTGD
ncbi:hypothetical protein Ddye_025896, partial [Dipteronia dyeriana]